MKLFGIEVERKTDILAMAAFLISTGSIIGQFALLIRGAEIILDGPRQLVLFFEEPIGGRGYLNAISTQIYVNKGTPGYDDILKSEALVLQLKGRPIELKAQEKVWSTASGYKLILKQRESWTPARIRAGEFVSNETLYVPYPSNNSDGLDINFLSRNDFISALGTSSEFKVILRSETYGGSELYSECIVAVRDILAGLKEKGWSSLECRKQHSQWKGHILEIPRDVIKSSKAAFRIK